MTDVARVELAPGYSIANIVNGCWQLTPDHGSGPSSFTSVKNRFSELVEHGFTTFDCADIYTGTEEMLGTFRSGRTDRDKIQIHTKFVPNRHELDQLNDRSIDAAIDLSRTKLGMERLDLVQFHWWDYEVAGLTRMYERLLFAQSVGKIRLLAVTNFNTEQLQRLVELDASIVAMQAQYSLLDRRLEKQMSQYCVENNIGLLSYGVLAGGFLSEKYLGQPIPADMNRSLQKYKLIIDDAGGWEKFQALLLLLHEIAQKHSSNIHSIAARWILDQPGVAAIILGIGSRGRSIENQSIAKLCLDAEDRECLVKYLATQRVPRGDPYDLERDADTVHYKIIRTELQESVA